MDAPGSIGWVDWTLLAVLLLSVMVGVWRGLVFELLSLVGWLVAYVLAQVYSPQVAVLISSLWPTQQAQSLPPWLSSASPHLAAAFALTFIAALVAWTVLARLVRMVIHATPLTLVDRALGAGFGLLRGAVLLLAVATLIAFTPALRSTSWQASQGAAWLALVLQGLRPVLPIELARQLPA